MAFSMIPILVYNVASQGGGEFSSEGSDALSKNRPVVLIGNNFGKKVFHITVPDWLFSYFLMYSEFQIPLLTKKTSFYEKSSFFKIFFVPDSTIQVNNTFGKIVLKSYVKLLKK